MSRLFFIYAFFAVCLCILFSRCNLTPDDPGVNTGNKAPTVELANIPPDDPTGTNLLYPEITFYWYGKDEDGYVTGFKYRTGTIKSINDTLWQDFQFVSAVNSKPDEYMSKKIITSSPEAKNHHLFEIYSIDDFGAESIQPKRLNFWTKKGPLPDTKLSGDLPDEAIVIDEISAYWKGLIFNFVDKDSKYFYSIDSGSWTFTDTNFVSITGKSFPKSGNYTISFKAINKFRVEDETPLSIQVKIIKPNRLKNILLIDMTTDGIGLPGSPSDEEVDNFYRVILEKNNFSGTDFWDTKNMGSFPSREIVAGYKLICIYSDNYYSDMSNKLFLNNINTISEYLDTGGRIILSGWNITNIFFNNSLAEDFLYKYLQIDYSVLTVETGLVPAIKPHKDYPILKIDSVKFAFDWNYKLANLQFFSPRAFAESIYTSGLEENLYYGKIIASCLKTEVYKAAMISLPLYYFQEKEVAELFRKLYEELN